MPDNTAVVLVDPLNDPLYVDGKGNKILQRSLEANSTIENLKYLVHGARSSGIPIYYALHQEYRDSNFHAWKYMSKSLKSVQAMRLFEKGSQGAQIYEGLEPQHGDVVVFRHWQSRFVILMCLRVRITLIGNSSFANTDLDFQLHQRQITHVILAELVANTCLESTARYAREL